MIYRTSKNNKHDIDFQETNENMNINNHNLLCSYCLNKCLTKELILFRKHGKK